jgi:hypothetical protein
VRPAARRAARLSAAALFLCLDLLPAAAAAALARLAAALALRPRRAASPAMGSAYDAFAGLPRVPVPAPAPAAAAAAGAFAGDELAPLLRPGAPKAGSSTGSLGSDAPEAQLTAASGE